MQFWLITMIIIFINYIKFYWLIPFGHHYNYHKYNLDKMGWSSCSHILYNLRQLLLIFFNTTCEQNISLSNNGPPSNPISQIHFPISNIKKNVLVHISGLTSYLNQICTLCPFLCRFWILWHVKSFYGQNLTKYNLHLFLLECQIETKALLLRHYALDLEHNIMQWQHGLLNIITKELINYIIMIDSNQFSQKFMLTKQLTRDGMCMECA